MSDNVIAVLTYKSIDTLLSTGGTQSWALDRARARNCKYALVCRNAKHPAVEGSETHGHAFMIGRVKDVVPSTETKGRWLVVFSEYAIGDFGEQWEGRNPVAYYKTTDFKAINFDKLRFLPMPRVTDYHAQLTIEQAKKGLAVTFGVDPENIEIIIRA